MTLATPVPISRVRPDVRDRCQTDRCQTKASLYASTLWGRRHNNKPVTATTIRLRFDRRSHISNSGSGSSLAVRLLPQSQKLSEENFIKAMVSPLTRSPGSAGNVIGIAPSFCLFPKAFRPRNYIKENMTPSSIYMTWITTQINSIS